MRKIHKDFARKLEFKDIRFPVKIRDIHKIEKENYISVSVFGYENRAKFSIYVSKNTFKENANLLSREKKCQSTNKHYIVIEKISVFIVCNIFILQKY